MEQMSALLRFLEVSQIWTILGLFLINTLLIKKRLEFAKINYNFKIILKIIFSL